MPYGKSYAVSKKKRKAKGRKKTVTLYNPSKRTFLPDRYVCTLTYTQNIPQIFNDFISGSDPREAYYIMRANSVYDPVYALGGNYAVGNKQLGALFNKFTVTSSSIKVEMRSWTGSTNDNLLQFVTICHPDDVTVPADASVQDLMGLNGCSKLSQAGPDVGQNVGVNYNNMSMTRVFGVKDILDDIIYSGGPLTNDPPTSALWRIQVRNIGTNPQINNASCTMTIKYKVIYSVPKIITDN